MRGWTEELERSHVESVRMLATRSASASQAELAGRLHQQILPSLVALDIEIELLLADPVDDSSHILRELERIQRDLRHEIVSLREVMRQLRSEKT